MTKGDSAFGERKAGEVVLVGEVGVEVAPCRGWLVKQMLARRCPGNHQTAVG